MAAWQWHPWHTDTSTHPGRSGAAQLPEHRRYILERGLGNPAAFVAHSAQRPVFAHRMCWRKGARAAGHGPHARARTSYAHSPILKCATRCALYYTSSWHLAALLIRTLIGHLVVGISQKRWVWRQHCSWFWILDCESGK